MSHVHGREGHHYFSDVPPDLMDRKGGMADDTYRYLPDHLTDPSLDRLATLAANLTGCPVARISIIDDRWVVCRASVGAPRLIIPSEQSFCARARALGHPLQINNPAQDQRFADLTKLAHNRGVQFYAAQPLIDTTGRIIGILSLRDVLPHTLDDSDLATLEDIAALAVERLETIALARQLRSASETSRALQMADSSLGLCYWRYDTIQNELFWSDGTYRLLGINSNVTPSYRLFLSLLTPEERPRVSQLIHRALRRQLPFSIKTTLHNAANSPFTLSLQGECDSKDGQTICVFGIAFCTPIAHL